LPFSNSAGDEVVEISPVMNTVETSKDFKKEGSDVSL
jgi:hypothetical protein